MDDNGVSDYRYARRVRKGKAELIKVICRSEIKEEAESFQKEVESILVSKGQEVLWIECDSIQDLEYMVSKEKDAVVLLQERNNGDERCAAWEIAAIRDIRNVRVIVCVKRLHYGTSFMAILYVAGIVDALFEEDADAVHIAERLLASRSRRECRMYYGIRSIQEVTAVLEIMEQDTLDRYVRYINGSADREEMLIRFHEVVKKLSYIEKCCFVEKMPEDIRMEIGKDVELEKRGFSQSTGVKRKK